MVQMSQRFCKPHAKEVACIFPSGRLHSFENLGSCQALLTGGRADTASGLTAQEHPCQPSAPQGISSGQRVFAAGPRHMDAHPGRVGSSEVDVRSAV